VKGIKRTCGGMRGIFPNTNAAKYIKGGIRSPFSCSLHSHWYKIPGKKDLGEEKRKDSRCGGELSPKWSMVDDRGGSHRNVKTTGKLDGGDKKDYWFSQSEPVEGEGVIQCL